MTLIESIDGAPGRSPTALWLDDSPELDLKSRSAATTVLVVSPSPIVRRGLAALLRECDHRCHPRTAATVVEASRESEVTEPSVIVVDVDLCEPSAGAAMCADLRDVAPGAALIVVAGPTRISTIKQCMAAGAIACLSADSDEPIMKEAFAMARRGQSYVDPRIAQAVLCGSELLQPAAIARLTPREQDVLRLLSEGCSNRAISSRLTITEKTVKGHVSSILAKLNASSRLAAALMAPAVL